MTALAPLAAWPHFIVCKLVPLPDGRTDKIPCDYRDGRTGIDAHDPQHWTDWQTADAMANLWGESFRVGFVLSKARAPVWVLDIDGALTPQGTWSDLSQQLVRALPGTACEVSQSGRGLHIWGQGVVPEHSKKNTALHIELYSDRRFVCLGRWGEAVGDMTKPCPQIAAVAAACFPPRAAGGEIPDEGPRADWRGPTDDDELIRRARRSQSTAGVFGGKRASFDDLWTGNVEALARAYPADASSTEPYDRSSADAALAQHLAFWVGCDIARMERLMRQSALVRDKWDDRDDYLVDRTIRGACARQVDVLKDKEPPVLPSERAPGTLLAEDPVNTARAMVAARYSHAEGRTLNAWGGAFYRWDGAAWVERSPDDMRAETYRFLEDSALLFKPNQSKVANAIDALKAVTHVDSRSAPPCWRKEPEPAPAAEIIACANGLLHLPTMRLLAPTPAFFNLNAVPFPYRAEAPAPARWLSFLAQVFPGDAAAVATLQEVFGYLLTADTSQQKIFLVVGPKRSGKGTIARVLTEMLGPDNVAGPTLASLAKDFGLAPLVGKLAAIVSDARLSGRTDQKDVAENLLRISGEDRVEINRKFLAPVVMRLGVRFLLLTNELPKIADASGAMASRFLLLTMRESFLGREDPALTAKLLEELPAILNWAIEGWHRLRTRGYFVQPESSAEASRELADLGSPVSTFVRECCHRSPLAEVDVEALYRAWCMWSARQGVNHTGSQQTFGRDLRAAFPEITTTRPRVEGERVRAYRGVTLRPA